MLENVTAFRNFQVVDCCKLRDAEDSTFAIASLQGFVSCISVRTRTTTATNLGGKAADVDVRCGEYGPTLQAARKGRNFELIRFFIIALSSLARPSLPTWACQPTAHLCYGGNEA